MASSGDDVHKARHPCDTTPRSYICGGETDHRLRVGDAFAGEAVCSRLKIHKIRAGDLTTTVASWSWRTVPPCSDNRVLNVYLSKPTLALSKRASQGSRFKAQAHDFNSARKSCRTGLTLRRLASYYMVIPMCRKRTSNVSHPHVPIHEQPILYNRAGTPPDKHLHEPTELPLCACNMPFI